MLTECVDKKERQVKEGGREERKKNCSWLTMGQRTLKSGVRTPCECNGDVQCNYCNSINSYCQSIRRMPLPVVLVAVTAKDDDSSSSSPPSSVNFNSTDSCHVISGGPESKNFVHSNWLRQLLSPCTKSHGKNLHNCHPMDQVTWVKVVTWLLLYCLVLVLYFPSPTLTSAIIANQPINNHRQNERDPFASNSVEFHNSNNYAIWKNGGGEMEEKKSHRKFDPTSVFSDIVEATMEEDDYRQQDRMKMMKEGRNVKQINDFDSSSSSEFKCHGSHHKTDCLVVLNSLKLKTDDTTEKMTMTTTTERQQQSSHTFKPTILPHWTTIQAKIRRRSLNRSLPQKILKNNSEENEILSRTTKSQTTSTAASRLRKSEEEEENEKKSLGPIRIFKYVHHPDELTTIPTTTTTTTTSTTIQPPTTTTVSPTSKNESSKSAEKSRPPPSPQTSLESDKDNEYYYEDEDDEEDELVSTESTTTERSSLIPNSFFGGKTESSGLNPNDTKTIVINGTLSPDGFRPRRSPYRPHWHNEKLYTHKHREALYQSHVHPPPPGLSSLSSSLPPPQAQMRMHVPKIRHGENRHPFVNPIPIPLPVPSGIPIVLPYNLRNNERDRDFSDGMMQMSDAESPEEQSSFRMPSFKNPFAKKRPKPQDGRTAASGNHRRPPHRPPSHHKGKRGRPGGPVPSVMPPPRPIPRPPRLSPQSSRINGHHHHKFGRPGGGPGQPGGGGPLRPNNIQYSYPKNAANIQDILSYFKQEENEILPGSNSKPHAHGSSSSIPSLSNGGGGSSIGVFGGSSGFGGGFSSELRDVQGSLLKDIREFAKRPSMMEEQLEGPIRDSSRERQRERQREERERIRESNNNNKPVPVPIPVPSIQSLTEDDDPSDEVFNPKPKPVRTLIKLRQREQETLTRERDTGNNGGGGGSNQGDYYKEEEEEEEGARDYGKKTKVRNRYHSSPSTSQSTRDRDNNHKYNDDKYNEKYNDNSNNGNKYSSSSSDPPSTNEDDYSKEDPPPTERPRHRDRYEQSSHHNRHNNNKDSSYKNTIKDDAYSEERPYANNLHPAPSVYYRDRQVEREERERERKQEERRQQQQQRERERHHHYNNNNNGNRHHRPKSTKSHRHKANRNRHKSSSKYASSQLNERFRDGHGREPGVQSGEFGGSVHSPNKISSLSSMDTAYYRQRNRPIVIKRPYQPYRPVDLHKIEQQRLNEDKHWNSVTTLKLNQDTKGEPSYNRQPLQKHYHYYGIGAVPASTNVRLPTTTVKSITPNDINTSLDDEDILEIHTGSGLPHVSTTPIYPPPQPPPSFDNSQMDRDKKARLQKMYMDYLQHKLEAQAEAMFTTPAPPAPRPKRPMRMKIHIYPNENTAILDRSTSSLPNPNNNNFYPSNHNPSSYGSASNKVFSSPSYNNNNIHRYGHFPPSQQQPLGGPPQQIIPAQSVHANTGVVGNMGSKQVTAQTAIDKNKNVVLHLHVHRRNDVVDQGGQMEMAGSEIHTSTVKPLTYDDIYETANSDDVHLSQDPPETQQEHEQNTEQDTDQETSQTQQQQEQPSIDPVDNDKSLSMELPIRHDKIEDVLSTLLKLRD